MLTLRRLATTCSTLQRLQPILHSVPFTSGGNKRNFITIVDQGICAYRELLGSNRTRLEPGIHLAIPIVHKITAVDLRESRIPVEEITAYTKDNVPVVISGSLFYKIHDAEKACYGVQSYKSAIQAVGLSAIRAVAGQFEYDQMINSRGLINDSLGKTVGTDILKWGAECTKFEIANFEPKNREVARQLELQMEAERRRRENELNTQAAIRTSGGEKQSAILKSEGYLVSQENHAKAQFITSQKEADALKYTIDATTDALTRQLAEVSKMFAGNNEAAAQYILEQKRLEHLKALSQTSNKVYFMDQKGMFPTAQAVVDMMKAQ